MTRAFRLTPLLALLLVGACTTLPSGPGVMVLPGTGKSFDQFRADDFDCRQFASMQVGGTAPNQAAADSGVKSAAVGTLVGAAAGADQGTDCGTLDPAVRGGLIGRSPAYLHAGKLSAVEIVGPKLVEALAGARQHHHPGTGGQRRARANQQQR